MLEILVCIGLGGTLAAMAGHQVYNAFKIGECWSIDGYTLGATRNDPPIWFWFITITNIAFGAVGAALVGHGLGLL